MNGRDFSTALLRTKLPQIFAESAVAGDGSDWGLTVLGLLGDISVEMEVTAFDGGRRTGQEVFDELLCLREGNKFWGQFAVYGTFLLCVLQ